MHWVQEADVPMSPATGQMVAGGGCDQLLSIESSHLQQCKAQQGIK
jgi:hypothetical protein